MEARRSVVVFGSLNEDISIACARLPQAGETVAGEDAQVSAGGKGANQAVAAARAGATTYLIGAVGADAAGDRLVAGLEEAGVDCREVARVHEAATGTAVVLRSAGDNRIVYAGGANRVRTPDDAAAAIERLIANGAAPVGSILLVQGECAPDATARAITVAHARGLYTIVNPAPVIALPPDAWHGTDLVCVNETECAALTGITPSDDASCWAALDALARLTGGGMGLITLGAAGSVAIIDDVLQRIPALECDAVDTTAAGDTYLGAFAAARVSGEAVYECMFAGARASALAVTRAGAQVSIPTRDEVWAWLEAGAPRSGLPVRAR